MAVSTTVRTTSSIVAGTHVRTLVERGLSKEEAKQQVTGPYRQHWEISDAAITARSSQSHPEWQVTTYADDTVTPRRTLVYHWGEWEERYQGKATLFGASEPGTTNTLLRRTFYAPQPLSKRIDKGGKSPRYTAAHVTMTKTPKGDLEESRRYREGDYFVLKRTYWSDTMLKEKGSEGIVSYEYFVSDNNWLGGRLKC